MGRYFGIPPHRLMLIDDSERLVAMAINVGATVLLSERDRIDRENDYERMAQIMMLGGVSVLAGGFGGGASAAAQGHAGGRDVMIGGLPAGTNEEW